MATRAFDIHRNPRFLPLFRALGIGPSRSRVEVTAESVLIQLGWMMRTRIPRTDIRSAERVVQPVGRDLVELPTSGFVKLSVDPGARARVCGVPTRGMTRIQVKLTDPDGFLAALESRDATRE